MTEEETLHSVGCIHCVVTSKDQKGIFEGGLERKTKIHVTSEEQVVYNQAEIKD